MIQLSIRKTGPLLAALSLVLILASLATANTLPQAFFANIDDTTDLTLGSLSDQGYIAATNPFTVGGKYPFNPINVGSTTNEGPNVFGVVILHAEYADPNPLPVGVGVTVNFNMFEPEAPTSISDTLSLRFTGIQDGTGANTSVDLQFISGATDEALLPPQLTSAFVVFENSDVSGLINQATSMFVPGGLLNAHVQFASVPEPSTVVLAGLGVVSVGFVALRKKYRRA